MTTHTRTTHVLIAAAASATLALAFLFGHSLGDQGARAAIAALPTRTPIVHIRTLTHTVAVTATPAPAGTATPAAADGPQHSMRGATYCTAAQVCVTLTGYTLDPEIAGVGAQDLDVWFHVHNRGTTDGGVDDSQFEAGITGGAVVNALPLPGQRAGMPDGTGANTELVAGGQVDGLMTFLVPASSHEATVRLLPSFSVLDDQRAYGAWDIRY